MYFSIIHCEIHTSFRFVSNYWPWMILNGLMTADARHLCGSWFFTWLSQFGRKLVLGTRRKLPRPRRDVILEMSIYWEFPWVPWVPRDSHRNGNRQASFMGMGMGMGLAWWEWYGIKTPHFPFPARKYKLIIRNS